MYVMYYKLEDGYHYVLNHCEVSSRQKYRLFDSYLIVWVQMSKNAYCEAEYKVSVDFMVSVF